MQRSSCPASGPASASAARERARGASRSSWRTAPRTCRSVPCQAGPHPSAAVEHGALPTLGRACLADQRAEFHHRDVPGRRRRCVSGHDGCRERGLRSGEGGRGLLSPLEDTSENPTHVGVDHGGAHAEGEGGNCCRRVRPDPGEGAQGLLVAGHPAVVALDDRHGRLTQPQCPARVPETSPGTDHLTRRLGRQVCGGRPPLHPAQPDGFHARDRRLLRHHLGDEDPPRRRRGVTPRQRSGVARVPEQDDLVQVGNLARVDERT